MGARFLLVPISAASERAHAPLSVPAMPSDATQPIAPGMPYQRNDALCQTNERPAMPKIWGGEIGDPAGTRPCLRPAPCVRTRQGRAYERKTHPQGATLQRCKQSAGTQGRRHASALANQTKTDSLQTLQRFGRFT